MNEAEKQTIIDELKVFYKELRSYKNRLLKSQEIKFTEAQNRSLDALRLKLQRKHGRLADVISKYGGVAYIPVPFLGTKYEVFSHSLSTPGMEFRRLDALDGAISLVNEAIGRLEVDIKMGIRDKQGRVIEELPKATEDYEEKTASKELELILEGTPDMIIECIMDFVKKLNSEGYAYKCIPRIGDAPDYAKWDKTYSARCAIVETHEGIEKQIVTIRLQLLPNERTLFKIPEPEDWDSSFGDFISHLLAEFKRLGFVYFEEERPPMGFKPPHKEKHDKTI